MYSITVGRGLGARLPPVADERSATREKTRSIATERERDDYVFEWADAPVAFI